MPPYQVRGKLIKSGMTVCVVIPAEAGIQRDGGSTLPITHYRLLFVDSRLPTTDWSYLTHHSLRITHYCPSSHHDLGVCVLGIQFLVAKCGPGLIWYFVSLNVSQRERNAV